MKRTSIITLLCLIFCLVSQHLPAQGPIFPKVERWQRTGSGELVEWQLSGTGEQVEPGILQVTGNGRTTSYWRSEPVQVWPGTLPSLKCFRFSVSHRGVDSSGGCLPCGIEGFTRDYTTQSNQWTNESFYFCNKASVPTLLKVGQWESNGSFQFCDIKLEPVIPVLSELIFTPEYKVRLGEGEAIREGKYLFHGNFGSKGTNIHRPFASASNAAFNSNRWCFGDGSEITYRFRIFGSSFDSPTCLLTDGKCVINICYHAKGEGVIEANADFNQNWIELARINKAETKEIVLPESDFPKANVISLRIRGLDACNFQVDRIDFEASLPKTYYSADLHSLDQSGETLFVTIDQDTLPVRHALVLAQKDGIKGLALHPSGPLSRPSEGPGFIPIEKSRSPGEIRQTFVRDGAKYSFTTQTHPFERSDYGYVLPSNRMASSGTFWWCEADWKVSRDRQPPEASPETAKPISISAAKNDVEGFQFVIRANDDTPITGLTGTAGELKGPNGATIPAENVELLYAYYHFVHSKTDDTGLIDYWPDALPPLDHPIDIAAGKNQPIWINIKVPADAVAGDYTGTFNLASNDGRFRVTMPYKLHVWNFALPQENHIETAYGYNPNQAARYHNARTDADRRRVNEMYLQCFSDHRISVYNPAPFDNFTVQWLPNENPPRCEIDFTRFDAEMDRVMKKFHFTNFRLSGHGLGGGTFHARTEPSIAGFAEDTPEYKAMFSDYCAKLQTHFIEKGWIDKAYMYWFDEPGQHDYEFVANGTAKMQQYAPKIQRFITLMMDNDGFMKMLDAQNTTMNIWCPVSNSFRDELAKQRMALGERFWWYVCTGPKAPYCTLFIDKPATELRVWHWQAWQRGIVGSLVWESTYWHSATAFPDSFQNPYDDPMGYVVGYSTPSGTKQHWGNGDGRFIYPPLAAAVPGLNDGRPVFDKPASSIRWEMIREGIEDYEMLYLLRELLKQKGDQLSEADLAVANELLTVPESITKSMTEFTIDPRPILQRRTAIAEMIEKLNR